jgi:CPA2 family monovalent cation:H+ antiporter-2
MEFVLGLFFILVAAVLGGIIGKVLKLPALVGYIIAGIFFGAIIPGSVKGVAGLAQLGTILLLFSIGVELSFDRLSKFLTIGVFGAILQVFLVTMISFLFLRFFGMSLTTSLILSLGFSISSTAVLVSILSDRGEMDTIHGGIMLAWSLVQDLSVIPIMVLLPLLTGGSSSIGVSIVISIFKVIAVIAGALIAGRLLVPRIIHYVAAANSRELLLLTSVALALGTAAGASALGISPALGAFLAGVVISASQEHHAIFAETRPLRDLFMALFFVSLGFLVSPQVILSKLPVILGIALMVIILKIVVVFIVNVAFGFRGRTAITTSFGLAQVGEFAFVIFSAALALKLIDSSDISLGIAVTLLTLIFSPILYANALSFWRRIRDVTLKTPFARIFSSGEKREDLTPGISEHIIICGYGRVGKWVGRALGDFGIPFVVVEYNQKIVQDLKEGGISVLYGDPTEPEVLEAVNIRQAKAVVLAIPDRVAQETLIAYIQTVAPDVKIISRVHEDSDWEKLKILRVDKVVQPEFEAAVEIIRSILISRGRSRIEISDAVKSLRLSHSS